jgi:hypothetical protein
LRSLPELRDFKGVFVAARVEIIQVQNNLEGLLHAFLQALTFGKEQGILDIKLENVRSVVTQLCV